MGLGAALKKNFNILDPFKNEKNVLKRSVAESTGMRTVAPVIWATVAGGACC
jgi:hypothetical protein